MNFEEEVKLFGQPIQFTVPGEVGQQYISSNTSAKLPILYGKSVYYGYAMWDIFNLSCSIHDIYLLIDNKLCSLSNWYFDIIYPLHNHMIEVQTGVSYDKIRKMFFVIYNKIEELQNEINNKVDYD